MRITLVHNPGAGDGDHPGRRLVSLLQDAGHEVEYRSSKGGDLGLALARRTDLLLVAGGDGTVGGVVRKLVREDVLLSILPMGNSNNIASALGIEPDAPPEQHVAALATAIPRRLDVGLARAPWGTELFLESAGVGCFAALIRDEPPPDGEPPHEQRAKAARRFERLLERAPARRRRVVADGVDLSGDYVLVAALNIPRIGPRAELAPGADPGDGLLDLVLVRDDEREEWIRLLARGGEEAPRASRRVKRIRMEWDAREGHLDDEPWPALSEARGERESHEVELELAPVALRVAVPRLAPHP